MQHSKKQAPYEMVTDKKTKRWGHESDIKFPIMEYSNKTVCKEVQKPTFINLTFRFISKMNG